MPHSQIRLPAARHRGLKTRAHSQRLLPVILVPPRPDLFIRLQYPATDLFEFGTIGFNQKWMILQHIGQKCAGGVHHEPDAPSLQTRQDLLVNILRKSMGHASCQHQRIALTDPIQLFIELCEIVRGDFRSLGIDFGFSFTFQLDVDPAYFPWTPDEIRPDTPAWS